jgi:hypothetical protein
MPNGGLELGSVKYSPQALFSLALRISVRCRKELWNKLMFLIGAARVHCLVTGIFRLWKTLRITPRYPTTALVPILEHHTSGNMVAI